MYAINFYFIVRWIFAIWVIVDPQRVDIYSRVRRFTCYGRWSVGFIGFVVWALYTVYIDELEEVTGAFLGLVLGGCIGIILCAIVDIHWCSVIKFYASELPKRNKRMEKEKAAKKKKEAELKKNMELNIDNEIGEDGMRNNVVLPDDLDLEIQNIPHDSNEDS